MPVPRTSARLGRVIRGLEAGAPLEGVRLARVLRLCTGLWHDLFADMAGTACPAALPAAADAATPFGPAPDAAHDPEGCAGWHRAQAGLFLHYAPLAGRLLGPASLPGERAAALLLPDALRLLAAQAGLHGRTIDGGATLQGAQRPFSQLIQRGPALRSHRSTDVNLGAVAMALAIESGFRHALALAPDDRLSMWRLFRALADGGVRLAVPLPALVAVYTWAGRHRSAGRRGFGWLNYYAADLTHPLFEPSDPAFGLTAQPAALGRLRDAATGHLPVEAMPFAPIALRQPRAA